MQRVVSYVIRFAASAMLSIPKRGRQVGYVEIGLTLQCLRPELCQLRPDSVAKTCHQV
jgi:hypothetical protein